MKTMRLADELGMVELELQRAAGPPTWETANCADAPALAKWLYDYLESEDVEPIVYGSSFQRLLYRWAKQSERADYFAVDRALNLLGLHPSQLPERLWLRGPSRPGGYRPRGSRF